MLQKVAAPGGEHVTVEQTVPLERVRTRTEEVAEEDSPYNSDNLPTSDEETARVVGFTKKQCSTMEAKDREHIKMSTRPTLLLLWQSLMQTHELEGAPGHRDQMTAVLLQACSIHYNSQGCYTGFIPSTAAQVCLKASTGLVQ